MTSDSNPGQTPSVSDKPHSILRPAQLDYRPIEEIVQSIVCELPLGTPDHVAKDIGDRIASALRFERSRHEHLMDGLWDYFKKSGEAFPSERPGSWRIKFGGKVMSDDGIFFSGPKVSEMLQARAAVDEIDSYYYIEELNNRSKQDAAVGDEDEPGLEF